MENNEDILENAETGDPATTETQLVPDGYYDNILDSLAFNNFGISIILGIIIAYLMIKGMKH